MSQSKPESETRTFLGEFIHEILSIIKKDQENKIYYRGHGDAAWELKPSIFRKKDWIKKEDTLIQMLYDHNPSEFSDCSSTFDMLVKMQHYGLPTRLLDITINPLVALYFACENLNEADGMVYVFSVPKSFTKHSTSDTISAVANIARCSYEQMEIPLFSSNSDNPIPKTANQDTDREKVQNQLKKILEESVPSQINHLRNFIQRCDFEFMGNDNYLQDVNNQLSYLHHQIGNEKSHYQKIIQPFHLGKSWVVSPKLNNKRIINQQGAFILFGLGLKKDEENHKIQYTKDNGTIIPEEWIIKKITIPQSSKKKIINELSRLGISKSFIYPEMEKYAEELKEILNKEDEEKKKED